MQLEPVIFQAIFGPYAEGQIAGFTPDKVRDLCNTDVKGADGYPKKLARIPTQAELDANRKAFAKAAPPKESVVGVLICGPNVAGYNPGDIAGFPKSVADKLVASGDGLPYVPPPEDPAKAAAGDDDDDETDAPRHVRRRGAFKSKLRGETEADVTK